MKKKYAPSVVYVERSGAQKPTVREELADTRIRPMGAPMATRDDDDGEGGTWSGQADYQEIPSQIPWGLICLVIWSWFVFLAGRASA